MYIYNVTTQISHQIHDAWVAWMKEKHIPEVMAKGCFTKFQFVRLLEVDESESVTYATQYYAESKADYNRYVAIHATALREDALKAWGNKTIGFRSLMQVIQ
jgi:Domain of unknown function (DUF4286)